MPDIGALDLIEIDNRPVLSALHHDPFDQGVGERAIRYDKSDTQDTKKHGPETKDKKGMLEWIDLVLRLSQQIPMEVEHWLRKPLPVFFKSRNAVVPQVHHLETVAKVIEYDISSSNVGIPGHDIGRGLGRFADQTI